MTSVHYSWMWDMTDVPCGLFVGVVNFTLGGIPKIVKTGGLVGDAACVSPAPIAV